MTADFENDSGFNDALSIPGSRRGMTLVEVLVVLGVVVLVIALLLPLSRSGGYRVVRRVQCVNNLKQIMLALYNYEAEYDALPPAYTVDAEGRPLHSWRTLILPYMEQTRLYESIDLAKPWNAPANAKALATAVHTYRCPSSESPQNTTTYLAIVGPKNCFDPTQPRRLEDVTDGTSSTLMVIEADDENAVPWMAPVDADEALVMSLGAATKLHHNGGMNASRVDGSVLFLKASTPAKVLRALMTIAGGEDVSSNAY